MREVIKLRHGEAAHVELISYPDGQHNVKLDLEYFNDRKYPIDIRCSIRNMDQLEVLLALVGALRASDFIVGDIDFVYLFGCRSDRVFEPGMPNYFRDVVAPIIHSIKCLHKRFLRPHGRSSIYLTESDGFGNKWIGVDLQMLNGKAKTVIAGDESAASMISCINGDWRDPMHFFKKRHADGIDVVLKGEWISKIDRSEEDTILIADDLCDGGGTFIAESIYLKSLFPNRKLQLFVYHMLTQRAVEHLAEHFDRIYCTNSCGDWVHPKLKLIEVI